MKSRDIKIQHVLEGIVRCTLEHRQLEDEYGFYTPKTHSIVLDPSYRLRTRIDTLIHEAIHSYHHGHNILQSNDKLEEKLTRDKTLRIMKRIYGAKR